VCCFGYASSRIYEPATDTCQAGRPSEVPTQLAPVSHVDVTDSDGLTALAGAARGGHVAVLELLLDFGASTGLGNLRGGAHGGGGDTPLHVAANWGKAASIACLLRRGADVHAVNDLDRTALHLAALNGHEAAVAALLEVLCQALPLLLLSGTPLVFLCVLPPLMPVYLSVCLPACLPACLSAYSYALGACPP